MLVATSSAALSVFYLIFILFFLPVSLGSMSCGTLAGTIYTIYILLYQHNVRLSCSTRQTWVLFLFITLNRT